MTADTAAASVDQPKAKAFISYSRKDMAFSDRLEAALKTRGFEVLIDRQEIYAFEDWWKRIEALIGAADTVVFVLSPDAVKSDIAVKELNHAACLNKRFAPIVCRRVEDGAVPDVLRRLNFIFFDEPDRFDASSDRLAEALRTDIGWVRQHTEYGEAERRWAAAGRPRGLLLHSPTLEIAEYWINSRPAGAPEPTAEIRAFIAASRKAARSAQRVWRLALASTFTFMAATILGLVGWINQAYLKEQWNWHTTMRPYRVANFDRQVLKTEAERALKPGETFRECAKDCPEMIVLPAGKFMMGNPHSMEVAGRYANETPGRDMPQHKVAIPQPFAVSKFDVTFADWDACVAVGGCPQEGQEGRASDAGWGRGTQPLIYVNWYDAQTYVGWLSRMTGKHYRLLTEAEWEFAARAGSTTDYYWGDEVGNGHANCLGCGSKWDGQQTAPVGSFAPNAFGLYDMAGNVWQWVEDCAHADYNGAPQDGSAWLDEDCTPRVVRGGAWWLGPRSLRSFHRLGSNSNDRGNALGFRVGRTLLPP